MLKLQKKFIVYFSIILIVIFSIFIELVLETSSPEIERQITNNIKSKSSVEEISNYDIIQPLRYQQKKMFVIVVILLILMVLLFYHFTNEVVRPLHKIILESKKILNGDLTVSITVNTTDEIKDVGETINELASNMQEVVVQIKNWITNIEDLNKELADDLKRVITTKKLNKKEFQDLLNKYNENTALLDDFLKLFKIYKMNDGVIE